MTTMTQTEQTCGPACWNAQERDCRCSCGGTRHGAALTGDAGQPLRREAVIDGHHYLLGTVTLAYHAYSAWPYQWVKDWIDDREGFPGPRRPCGHPVNTPGAIMWRRLASVSQSEKWPEVLQATAEIRGFREAHAHGRPVRVPRPYLIWIREDAAADFDAFLERERAGRAQDVAAGYAAAS